MDFVLRRDDFPGARRAPSAAPASCAATEEFGRALEYFRGHSWRSGHQGHQGRLGRRRQSRRVQSSLSRRAEATARAGRSGQIRGVPDQYWRVGAGGRIHRRHGPGRHRIRREQPDLQPHRRHFSQAGSKRERERRRPRPGAADGRGFAGAGVAWQAIVRRRHRRRWSARVRPTDRERYRPRQPVATAARTPDTARAFAARSASSGGTRRRRWRAARAKRAGADRARGCWHPARGRARPHATRRLGDLVDHVARPVPSGMAGRHGWAGGPSAAPWFLDRDHRQIVVFKPPDQRERHRARPGAAGPEPCRRPGPPRPHLARGGPFDFGPGSPPGPGAPTSPAARPPGPIRRRPPATCQRDRHRRRHGLRRRREAGVAAPAAAAHPAYGR